MPVVVTAAPDAAAMVRRLLARHLRDDDGSSTTVRLAFAALPHAVGSLLGLGTRVEVLDPPELRTAMRDAALAVAALYRPGD